LPKAGACARCPKRTGSNPLLFPEVRQKSTCTDRECYRAKIEALVQIQVKPLEEKGEKPLRVSQAPAWQANGHAKDVLFEGQYRKAKAKGECPNTKAAVPIDAKGAGSVFYVCQTEKCDVHNRVTRYQPTPQEQAQRKRVSGFVLANPEKSRKHLPSASRSCRGCASSKSSARSKTALDFPRFC